MEIGRKKRINDHNKSGYLRNEIITLMTLEPELH